MMKIYTEGKRTYKSQRLEASVTIFLLLSIFSAAYYLFLLLNPNNIGNAAAYLVLLFIEWYIIFQTVGSWWTMLYSDHNSRYIFFRENKEALANAGKVDGGVAILITVYGEDPMVVQNTAIAAKNMEIEHDTFILDDGRSEKIRKLAKSLGVNYITRETNENKKAGNINNALKQINHSYIAVFDADHTPKPDFLLETLPFFYHKDVAFVQTPQTYSNRENVIARGAADSQKLFYNIVSKGKNRFNSAFWVGTNAIFRKEALEDVGGVFPHSSEDLFTSYELHQKGWRSIYINEQLSVGESPNTLSAYFNQQVRWAAGAFTMFFKDNPLTKNLTIDQKIQYLLTSTFYFSGLVVALMIALPALYLLFGIKPIHASLDVWALHYLPFFASQFLIMSLITKNITLDSYILSINSFPAYIRAMFLVLLNKPINWSATNASLGQKASNINYLWTHIFFLVLNLAAIPIGLINVTELGTTAINIFWGVLNVFFLGTFVYKMLFIKEVKYE